MGPLRAILEVLLRVSIAVRERVQPRGLGLPAKLNRLASLLIRKGRFAQAAPLARRALEIHEPLLGPEHHFVAWSLDLPAVSCSQSGGLEEAARACRRALALRRKTLPAEDLRVAWTLVTLGSICFRANRLGEAEQLYREGLVAYQKDPAGAPSLAHIFCNLGHVLTRQQRHAERSYRESIAVLETVLGPDHRHVTRARAGMAGIHLARATAGSDGKDASDDGRGDRRHA